MIGEGFEKGQLRNVWWIINLDIWSLYLKKQFEFVYIEWKINITCFRWIPFAMNHLSVHSLLPRPLFHHSINFIFPVKLLPNSSTSFIWSQLPENVDQKSSHSFQFSLSRWPSCLMQSFSPLFIKHFSLARTINYLQLLFFSADIFFSSIVRSAQKSHQNWCVSSIRTANYVTFQW